MPIDISTYHWSRLRHVADLHCVYVIAPMEGFPCKIGRAQNIVHRFAGLQSSHWHELLLHDILWAIGSRIIDTLEQQIHKQFKCAKIRGEWFNIMPEEASKTLWKRPANFIRLFDFGTTRK